MRAKWYATLVSVVALSFVMSANLSLTAKGAPAPADECAIYKGTEGFFMFWLDPATRTAEMYRKATTDVWFPFTCGKPEVVVSQKQYVDQKLLTVNVIPHEKLVNGIFVKGYRVIFFWTKLPVRSPIIISATIKTGKKQFLLKIKVPIGRLSAVQLAGKASSDSEEALRVAKSVKLRGKRNLEVGVGMVVSAHHPGGSDKSPGYGVELDVSGRLYGWANNKLRLMLTGVLRWHVYETTYLLNTQPEPGNMDGKYMEWQVALQLGLKWAPIKYFNLDLFLGPMISIDNHWDNTLDLQDGPAPDDTYLLVVEGRRDVSGGLTAGLGLTGWFNDVVGVQLSYVWVVMFNKLVYPGFPVDKETAAHEHMFVFWLKFRT